MVMACLVMHNLLRRRYPTGQAEDFGGEGQPPIVLEGNDIPHEGRNPLEAGPLANGQNLKYCDTVTPKCQ